VGRCTRSISHAVLADLPVPVAPSSTTSCSSALIRRSSSSMACGWSPDGRNSLTTSNRPVVGTRSLLVRTPTTVRGGYDKNLAGRSEAAGTPVAQAVTQAVVRAAGAPVGPAAVAVFPAPRWALPPGQRVGVLAAAQLAGAAHAPPGRAGRRQGRRAAGRRRGGWWQVAGRAGGGPAGRWPAGGLPTGLAEPRRRAGSRVPEDVLDRPPDL